MEGVIYNSGVFNLSLEHIIEVLYLQSYIHIDKHYLHINKNLYIQVLCEEDG